MPHQRTASVLSAAKQYLQTRISEGPKYVNVNEGFLVNFIYSKILLCFLSIVAVITAINTFIFSHQISESNLLCRVNDYLPLGKPLRNIVLPVVYYCRFVEVSVPINALQLALCVAALICAINRRSTLFLLCYCMLCGTLFVAAIFFLCLIVLNYERHIEPAVSEMLNFVLEDDKGFCDVLEPILDCRIPGDGQHDLIEMACGRRTYFKAFAKDCRSHLTSFLLNRVWMVVLMVEYNLLILVGIFLSFRALIRKRLKLKRSRQNGADPLQSKNGHIDGDIAERPLTL
jgi:hypothetical protein